MDYGNFNYGDFGVTGAPAATALSPEVQAYVDRLKAYEQAQRDAGYLVRPSSTLGTDYAALMAQNINPENYYQKGYEFRTNAGKLAKAKANPTAQIFYDPNKTYVFENERKNHKGSDYSTFDVSDQASFDRMYAEAQRLSQSQGKKADWRVFEVDPTTGRRTVVADDDPKGPLGQIADIGLPILGALLAPVTGGLSAAAAAGLGAAGGSILSGTLQGRSIGDIAKGAAISGLGSFAGASLLNGVGGVANSFNPSAITNEALRNAGSIAAGGVGSGAGSAAGSVVGGLASSVGDIVVNGVRSAGSNIGSFLGNAGAAIGGGFGGLANTGGGGPPPENIDPNTIEVQAAKAPIDDWGALAPVGAVGAGAAAAGAAGGPNSLGGQLAEAAAAGKLSPDIVDYLRAAGLLTGLVGDLVGGSGSSGKRGTWNPGAINPVFSKQLPTSGFVPTNRSPRDMPAQDWNKYGMQPEQSFWSDVPQRYVPQAQPVAPQGGLPATPQQHGPTSGRLRIGGFAKGGRADDQLARVSEGEYIIDAETVALLGDGSNEAGARQLDAFRVNLRKDKGRKLAKGAISPNAKAPAAYMKGRT